ncbi:MAG: helix-turn-helix transcriptional regulator [Ruminococcus sp.]|nr:helix-turn-helix transcriptional regulator [Ruminococcus sp.]
MKTGNERELRLRNHILDHYTSLRQFAVHNGIPYSTLMTLLTNGIGGASFDTIMQICKALHIDPYEI